MRSRISLSNVVLLLWDILLALLAPLLAALATHTSDDIFALPHLVLSFAVLALVVVVVFWIFRVYHNIWRYASGRDVALLVVATVVSFVLGGLAQFALGWRLPWSVYGVAWGIFLVATLASRFAVRAFYQKRRSDARRPPKQLRLRTLVVGAGETGSYVIRRMDGGDYAMQGLPVCAVDDDPKKQGQRINNVKVKGTISDITKIVGEESIQQIVMAIPSASESERKRIYDICTTTDCNLLTLPNVKDLSMAQLDTVELRQVKLSDLLSRDEFHLDIEAVAGYLRDRSVIITGGGGSIGSELARQVCKVAPRQLVIFDVYENTTYELERELKHDFPDLAIYSEIGSMRDPGTLEEVFKRYQPQVVFHAAAHKHVPLMEAVPREAIVNNVSGTYNLLVAAERFAVDHFVFISTDKAVNPENVMGASKRVCELLCQDFATHGKTKICAVRFGNVLGSHGSVIPFFTKQIAAGGPVTVTHPDIERYFMTIPEAVSLVLTAGAMAESGEIFILKMGLPVKIDDMARKLIRLSGHVPGEDIEIIYTGLRPGEKLYEELLQTGEKTTPTKVPDILISTLKPDGDFDAKACVQDLEQRIAAGADDQQLRQALQQYVPNYHFNGGKNPAV
ncbi:MAG: polysaccharide biosynthesis protein [Coriobacteriales bacterium]|jgi:FlaA1/EpsC-like NDP-sugar epimerase|nr:polysaccharide biosynthesis protein [Coriobacteriales bacterium]